PPTENARKQLMPSGLSWPFSGSVSDTLSCGTPLSVASSPACAFHTPRAPSVRAKIPATAPIAEYTSSWLLRSGLGYLRRGKNSAEFALRVPIVSLFGSVNSWVAVATLVQFFGESTSSIARRRSQ